jgi:Uma2 family endonuclease
VESPRQIVRSPCQTDGHEELAVTALTQPPGRLLTISDYAALGEDDRSRWELQEGNLIRSPSPAPHHMVAAAELYVQLRNQLPSDACAIPDVDIDVQLAPAEQPGTARRPDLVVVDRAEFDRVCVRGGLLRASAVLVVVEILSPGSRRMDTFVKRGEYADARIPNYWILDVDTPVSLVACHLAGEFGYQDSGEITGVFETDQPFPIRIDLDALA